MRSVLVILVFIIRFVNCSYTGFSEHDKLQNTEKHRVKPEFYEKYLGKPKKFHKTLQSSLKEIVSEKQRKRCDACRDSIRCKAQGKCDLCIRLCKDVEATTIPSSTKAPLLGSIQFYLDNVNVATEPSVNELAPLERLSRYYTIGAFGPGPKQNLLMRLLNVAHKDNVEKLVVLAKPEGGIEDPDRPIIIDTASVFHSTEESDIEIDPEVHAIGGNKMLREMGLELTSKIDHELDMAAERKKEMLGESHLTSGEVDDIVDKTLSMFQFGPPHQPNLSEDVVEIGSRINTVGTTHITTKRSVANWQVPKIHEKNLNGPLLGARQSLKSNSELENLSPKFENNHIQRENASQVSEKEHLNEETNMEHKIQGDSGARELQNETSYQGDSQLSKDECVDGADKADFVVLDVEDVAEYEPTPPTNFDESDQLQSKHSKAEQTVETVNDNRYTTPGSETVSQKPTLQNTPEVLSVSINNNEKPESASMHLGKTEDPLPLQFPKQQTNFVPMKQHKEAAQNLDAKYGDVFDEDEDTKKEVILTLTQAPENTLSAKNYQPFVTNSSLHKNLPSDTNFSIYENNASEPIVGSWFTDEWNKAKSWWRSHVGMEEPQNLTDAVDNPELFENQTNENLQLTESRTNLINASHFTLILKNLERKVEDIADLVEKTCGKRHPDEETVGLELPIFIKKKEEETPLIEDNSANLDNKQRAMVGNQMQIIEIPDNQTADMETITTVAHTEKIDPSTTDDANRRPHILDTALERLHKGTNFLINKAVDMAEKLQEGLNISQRAQDKPLATMRPDIVNAADLDRVLFSGDETTELVGKPYTEANKDAETQDTTVACSRESDEYVGEKLQSRKLPLESRSGYEPEVIATTTSAKATPEENVACSNEDFNEYVGNRKQTKPAEGKEATEKQPRLELKMKDASEQEQNQENNNETSKVEQTSDRKFTTMKSSSKENVACSQESGEYVGNPKQEDADEFPETYSNFNLSSKKPVHRKNGKIIEDGGDKVDSESTKLNSLKIPQSKEEEEEVGCSGEEYGGYVGENKKEENSKENVPGNEQPIGYSTKEKYLPSSTSDGLNNYRESNSQPKSSSSQSPIVPKHHAQLLQIPSLDNLLHRDNTPHHLREGSLQNLSQQSVRIGLPKISRILNRNRNHNVPSSAQQSNIAEVFSTDIQDYQHTNSNTPAESNRLISEPDNSKIAQSVNQFRATDLFPIGSQSLKKNFHLEILKPHENAGHQPVEPSQQRHQLQLPFQDISPLNEDIQFFNPDRPAQQHSDKVLSLPALDQRFAEHERVSSDGFHVHRPKHLQNWPELPNRDEIVGSKQNWVSTSNTEVSSTMYTQNPFSIFGKVVPQINNTEISFHDIPSNKIYFVGTGVHLPLNMKKHNDGSYQLSVDIDKLCNNCNENSCNKKSDDVKVGAVKKDHSEANIDDEVVGLQPPPTEKTETHKLESDQHNTPKNRTSKPEQDLEQHTKQEEEQSEIEKPHSQKIEIIDTEATKFRNRRVPSNRKLIHHLDREIESQTNKQNLFEHRPWTHGPKIQPTFRYVLDSDLRRKNSHSEISKRSPKLELGLAPLTKNNRIVNDNTQRHTNEAPLHNLLQVDNFDKSLKKIDHNMKRYFDRRQKLEDYYKEQNKRDLEEPDTKKDIVKRRVTLVNNVLTWMKNIAV